MNTTVKTIKQIAAEYGISERTLRRYLKKFNINLPSGNITPKDQNIIYNTLGRPVNISQKTILDKENI